jgi:methyl-accepting chemotaxis protein
MFKKLGLRGKVLIPVLALIIIGMGASSLVSYFTSKRAMETIINAQIEQVAASSLTIINTWIRARKLDVSNWSGNSIFSTALKDTFVGKASRISASQYLVSLRKDYHFYEIINLANTAGDILASSDEKVIGAINVKDRKYFIDALQGNLVLSEVLKSRATGNPVFTIASPVKENNQITGVLFGVIDVNSFSKMFVDPVKIGRTGYAYMYQADGLVIAHPVKENILKLNLKDLDFGRQMMTQGSGLMRYVFNGVEKMVSFKKHDESGWTVAVGADRSDILEPVKNVGYITGGLGIAVLVLAAAVILLIVSSIVKPLYRVSAGLKDAALQVSSAASEVSSSSQSLAAGASEQAASIEETSSSLEEIASMARQNAENASHASTLANETKSTADLCSKNMQDMSKAIGQVNEASQQTQKIIKTIDEIAFQTNLLALNAAVEAARAGEAGAGFAVVADEVRNLAMRAAEAAKNTTQLIDDITNKIRESIQIAERTVEQFSQVDANTKKVNDLVGEIAAASNEQAQGVEQVNKAVAEMEKVVQQNAASAEESASASEEMSAQAETMQAFVRDLDTLVGGVRKQELDSHNTEIAVLDAKPPKGKKTAKGPALPTASLAAPKKTKAPSGAREISPKEVIPLD